MKARRGSERTSAETLLIGGDAIQVSTQIKQSAGRQVRRGLASHVEAQAVAAKKLMANSGQAIIMQTFDDANMWVKPEYLSVPAPGEKMAESGKAQRTSMCQC